jgi:hypothetical protein
MYIRNPVFDDRIRRAMVGKRAQPGYQRLEGLQGTHSGSMSFHDPNLCWQPGSTGKPDLSKIIFNAEASLEIPDTCTGSIIARTILRDTVPGGASLWAEVILFGASDGTNSGGMEKATTVVESDGRTLGTVQFVKTIAWNGTSCTAGKDLFVYVKYQSSGQVFTFIEIGFFPRVEFKSGALIDKSPNPSIRLNPCNGLIPIRSPYVPGKESQQYWKLPANERSKVNVETNRVFKEETGIARRLLNNPSDQPLVQHWLRIRDRVMSARQ